MIQFFQVLFFTAAIVLIVINVLDFNKYQEGKKEGSTKPHPIKWVHFYSYLAGGIRLCTEYSYRMDQKRLEEQPGSNSIS